MKNYTNEEILFSGCPGCAFAKHEFELPCGMAYENDNFTVAQDWGLPIEGFFIVSPKRHVERLIELTNDERNAMFDVVNKTIKILIDNDICDRFEIIIEEKDNKHLHVWILPRHKWMLDLVGKIIDNIKTIKEYAKTNFRNEEVYERINSITKIVKDNLQD